MSAESRTPISHFKVVVTITPDFDPARLIWSDRLRRRKCEDRFAGMRRLTAIQTQPDDCDEAQLLRDFLERT